MAGPVLRKLFWRLFFFVACSLLLNNAAGQILYDGIPYIKNYTRQDYNSSPFNWGVVQDSRGIIYVANNYQVMEFDGITWRTMPLPNRTVIRSLAIDNKGVVYVGGQADFGFLQPDEKGELRFVSLKSKIDEHNNIFADVWRILVTEQGLLSVPQPESITCRTIRSAIIRSRDPNLASRLSFT